MINETIHFEVVKESGTFLNKQGKRIFIDRIENKLAQSIKVDNRVITYRMLIRNEVKKLQNPIIKNEKYKPYKYY